jgi:hypothetical protein
MRAPSPKKEFSSMRKLALVAACLLLITALPLHAKTAFSGVYSIRGTNPANGAAYRGTLTISPRGDIYDVLWDVGGVKYGGVGVVNGETLSVAYAPSNYSFMGVVSYVAKGNGLEGKWAVYGAVPKIGTETATRK